VETIAKTYGVAAEDDTERTAARDVDAAAVGHSDVVVICVGNVILGKILNRAHVTGSPAVDTHVWSAHTRMRPREELPCWGCVMEAVPTQTEGAGKT
jgi:hypothetical protein